MMALSFLRKGFCNIVIEDDCIRYCQVNKRQFPYGTKLAVKPIAKGIIEEGKIIDETGLSLILQSCVEDWQLHRKKVRFIVPDGQSVVRSVVIPDEVPAKHIHGYLDMEIGASIHLPFQQPVFDYHLMPNKEVNEEKRVLLVAAEETLVHQFEQVIAQANVYPEEAEITALSLWRLSAYLGLAEDNESVVIIHFEKQGVHISIIHHGIPMLVHYLPYDDNIELTNDDYLFTEVYREVDRLQDFHFFTLQQTNHATTSVLLSGENIIHSFQLFLSSRMTSRIAIVDARKIMDDETIVPSMNKALGLALKDVL
ncbi:type IV pilus biogenesis protein PilM [Cytobacillus sp. FSL R7-0680]|uniref:type IV pilus biogenesis protein PilM n=1 Tax=Cytobacillus sp. FSL R7-0680 TaxID=2921689 RepID=UPI0030FCBFF3